jgi:hypothetical protein
MAIPVGADRVGQSYPRDRVRIWKALCFIRHCSVVVTDRYNRRPPSSQITNSGNKSTIGGHPPNRSVLCVWPHLNEVPPRKISISADCSSLSKPHRKKKFHVPILFLSKTGLLVNSGVIGWECLFVKTHSSRFLPSLVAWTGIDDRLSVNSILKGHEQGGSGGREQWLVDAE